MIRLLSLRGKPYLLDSANKIASYNIEMSSSEPEMMEQPFENPTASASEVMKGGRRRRRTHRRRSHRNRRNNMSMRNRKNRRNTRRNRKNRNRK